MRVIILGHNGMLGQMAARYFAASGYEIVTIEERFDFTASCPALAKLSQSGQGLVLNCIGRIKQKGSLRQELFDVNAVLPLQLYERLGEGQFLIQPSTDCVFAGDRPFGAYASDNICDATDDYGWSKRLGEIALLGKDRAAIVRVSIIGPDWVDPNPKGLLGWFLSQSPGAQLNGFDNHFWNGVTTFEWCRRIEALSKNLSIIAGSLVQLGTKEVVSKYEMLTMFQHVFSTHHDIAKFSAPNLVNRSLVPEIISPSLSVQLIEMRKFWDAQR